MFASNAALIYIPYPTQVLAKACKPIPVMLVGFLFLGKKYRWWDWFFVLLIVLGISLFLYKDKAQVKDIDDFYYYIGMSLLLLSLACDGFTGPLQESIFRNSRPSPIRMMMLNNFYACLICFIAAFGFTNQGVNAISFFQRHPDVILTLLVFTILAALGQICIFLLVSQFGALVCSITTTTRKFFTIFISVLYYGHILSGRQYIGVILVFIGLTLNVLVKYIEFPPRRKEE